MTQESSHRTRGLNHNTRWTILSPGNLVDLPCWILKLVGTCNSFLPSIFSLGIGRSVTVILGLFVIVFQEHIICFLVS